jgi:predicted metalloprotease with PDZ domain
LGGKKVMDITVFKELQFGPYHFRKVPGYIFSDEFNVTSYPILGGLIGNDLLRRFNVILNYPDQVIYLKPNTHFNDNFDYSYTGMGIYMVDGQVTVVDIIAGSPGEKAGFKEGDIIYAIDKDVSRNIQSIKSALQVAGARVKVLVMRNKELLTLDLHIKDMLRK